MKTQDMPEVNWAELYGKLCEAVDHAGYEITTTNGLMNIVPKATPAAIQVRQFSARLGRWTDWELVTSEYYERNRNKPGQIEWRFLHTAPVAGTAGVPEGWRLVPVEPTREMLDAPQHVWPPEALKCWNEMLAAAPTQANT